ncbi:MULTISPECIES: orotidine-5'-phosphate decarboxylase [Sphingobacterium]|jgi:orotidine-5'-phosphate decarboxylase|uniref:Orotidine-5'-phosphate decarboxylase n=1 Tax=Sphingobacterium paramultivorum TaxID=2886510 RepID=A0A7G5DZX1_9SPHI|nr:MULTISPECIES: orotidine-5'-phosphate decarboxylase [Sphingobacterium]MBB1643754.1 orotidine 5'-phosphate decarboxylase [Sphingobacterium sp. UME9]MCS4164360.1 orotidine-5'-phosphate decarboxylase [Sphingobacterium sp. BIGb0116]QMV67296.1 orotidine-5'-phosphate decarboxylase [Sphingobacterium paramultivorum]QRY55401.1 orotidine-5'-phosphate decarboxylase [Sphingobacterium siyangense]WON93247.1 orotidine-5'-phosphate decarboxylase [Sphingobacterium sp. UGAL515B_05]
MTRAELIHQIKAKRSFLCVGLDTDLTKIPEHLLDDEDPIYSFNKAIIDATADLCVAYKPNIAFYECYGIKGWQSLQKTWAALPKDCFSIADAKRGDIGNTSGRYAMAFFDEKTSGLGFDSITIAPYMGKDSVTPFLDFNDKWAIVLALTSNEGSLDFQNFENKEGLQLFEQVIDKVNTWGTPDNLMYVVGATRGEGFIKIREHAPDHFLLVPGVGAQGGSLEDVCKFGMNKDCGLLVNSTRGIIYASKGRDFAERAREEALILQKEMEVELLKAGIIS